MKKNFDVFLSDDSKAFIKSLNPKVQKKVVYNIQKSREVNDPRLLKKITTEIWEFRTNHNNLQIRLLAFWDSTQDSLIICTHGFKKKTQKVPRSEIEKALKFKRKYINKKI